MPKTSGTEPGVALGNLQQRIISALVMVAVALGLVYAGVIPFAFLVLAAGLMMSWEWGHLVRGTRSDLAILVHGGAVALAVVLGVGGSTLLALCALLAGSAAIVPLTIGQRAPLSAFGVFYVGLPAVALLWLRGDDTYGFLAVFFLFLIVWSTDTMAYVAGRTIGGAKLWPSVSPNKTWAGFLGGIGSSMILCALFALLVPGTSPWRLGILGLLLGIVAQGGDLAESALKRTFGVKDASDLIPGHGGLMDRLDGLVAVAVASAIYAMAVNVKAPATALLTGV
jgi:phosphatidate cytidylyltransferase